MVRYQASKKTDFTVDLTWWGSLRLVPTKEIKVFYMYVAHTFNASVGYTVNQKDCVLCHQDPLGLLMNPCIWHNLHAAACQILILNTLALPHGHKT